MKRLFLILLCVALCAATLGCAHTDSDIPTEPSVAATEPVTEPEVYVLPDDYMFPVGTRIFGIHVGRTTIADAAVWINEAASVYALDALINEVPFHLTGRSLALCCDEEALAAYALALETGEDTEEIRLLDYDERLLYRRMDSLLNSPSVSTTICFDKKSDLYILTPSSSGWHVDMDQLMSMLDDAIQEQSGSITAELPLIEEAPLISDTSRQATGALEKANAYLTTEITYNFTTLDNDVEHETITQEMLLSMIAFRSDLTPYIKGDVVMQFVNDMNEQYGMTGVDGAFYATGGAKTDLTVTYYAQSLDVDALYEEILYYLDKGISGTRLPPELDTLTPQDIPFGGNYIEIDLTNQKLYLYKNTECILETPIVTGCVSRYMRTPTGVYSVLTRRMHVILKGEDYETYVKYWMQFRGGYGLHDAYWRSNFNSNEYLYNGSHGCVNIPPTNAAFVYENIYQGYPVILYGGATNDGPLQQNIVGTEEYNTSIHTKPFRLDAQTEVNNCKLTYTSSNPAVASVSEDGTVTVHKSGHAYITASYEESRYYTGATMRIKINVNDPCTGEHSFGDWETTVEPTCVKGMQVRHCQECFLEESKSVAAVDAHDYGEWELINEPECEDGLEQKECSVCGDKMNRTIPAEHNLRDWRVRTKPTCTEPGERYRACRWCDYEETEVLPALGHSFDPDEEFCDLCDARNPDWIPPTEPEKEDEEE